MMVVDWDLVDFNLSSKICLQNCEEFLFKHCRCDVLKLKVSFPILILNILRDMLTFIL